MKTIRKVLALSLSALLLLTTLPLTALPSFADEDTFVFTVDTRWTDTDVIEVTVNINTNLYLGSGVFCIGYPSSTLELIVPSDENKLCKLPVGLKAVNPNNAGEILIGFGDEEYITEENTLCVLPFRVKDTSAESAGLSIYTTELYITDPYDVFYHEKYPDNFGYDTEIMLSHTHTYNNDCDNYCNVCWKIREVPPHTYGTDNLCTVCNYPRPVEDYFTYEIENGKATITAVDKSIGKDIKVPERLDDAPVTCIGPNAFEGCTALRSIILLNGITSIDANAFSNCTSLLWVAIPDSVTQIDSNAFSGCTALADVYYSGNEADRAAIALANDGNTPLLNAAWHYIDATGRSFTFVSETTQIESDIIEVTIGYDSDLYLTNGEFEIFFPADALELLECNGQFLVEFNDNNKDEGRIYAGFIASDYRIGKASFGTLSFRVKEPAQQRIALDINVELLNHLSNPRDLWTYEQFPDYTGSNFRIYADLYHTHTYDNDCDTDCNTCGETRKADHTYGEDNLCDTCGEDKYLSYYTYSVSVENGVTITGVNAAISGHVVLPATRGGYPVTSIGRNAFSSCTSLTSVMIPDSVTSIGDSAFYHCTSLSSVTIPDSVTSIGHQAFSYCSSLSSVTIPDSVTSIEHSAFSGCAGLLSLTVEDQNTVYHSDGNCVIHTADKELVAGCNTSVIPSDGSVTSIEDSAFSGCAGLTSVNIPDSVTRIGDFAFDGCTSLTSVDIPDSVTRIGAFAFVSCKGLSSVTIGNGVTSIGDTAFSGCTALTSVTIPDSMTIIDARAFEGCTALASVTIPDSVTRIGTLAFGDTAYYNNEANWENGVLYIGNHLISAKETVEGSYRIKEGTKTIADRAFDGYTALTSVTIPDSVTNIGWSAFFDCMALTDVYYSGSEADRAGITIDDGNAPLLNATWHYNHVCACNHVNTVVENAKDATCTADGYTGDTICTDCGETVTMGAVIPMIDHTYTDEADTACNACGFEREPSIVIGNVDGSGKVDSTDARMVLQYAVKKIDATALTVAAADVDDNGRVDSTDARLILQYAVKKIDTFPAA